MQLKECGICHRVGFRAFVPWGDVGWCCARDDLCRDRVQRTVRRWMRPLSTQALLGIACAYQTDPRVHPLTCGNDSSHVLHPKQDGSAIILRCPKCSYDQWWIPWEVLRHYALARGLTREG